MFIFYYGIFYSELYCIITWFMFIFRNTPYFEHFEHPQIKYDTLKFTQYNTSKAIGLAYANKNDNIKLKLLRMQ